MNVELLKDCECYTTPIQCFACKKIGFIYNVEILGKLLEVHPYCWGFDYFIDDDDGNIKRVSFCDNCMQKIINGIHNSKGESNED